MASQLLFCTAAFEINAWGVHAAYFERHQQALKTNPSSQKWALMAVACPGRMLGELGRARLSLKKALIVVGALPGAQNRSTTQSQLH